MIYKYDNWDPRTGEYSGTVNLVSFRLGVSQAAFRWHWPPLWLLLSLLSYQFWLLGGLEPPSHALHDELLAAAAYAAECSPVHKSCHLAAVFVVPVATSVAASREVFQNYSQTTNDMKRPNASRSFPKKSKKRLPGATGYPPSPGILLRFPALFPLGSTASPSDRSQPFWWGRRSESRCPDSRLELGLKAMSFGQLLTFEIVWVVLWWSLSQVLVFCVNSALIPGWTDGGCQGDCGHSAVTAITWAPTVCPPWNQGHVGKVAGPSVGARLTKLLARIPCGSDPGCAEINSNPFPDLGNFNDLRKNRRSVWNMAILRDQILWIDLDIAVRPMARGHPAMVVLSHLGWAQTCWESPVHNIRIYYMCI